MTKKGFSRGFSKNLLFLLGGVIVIGILLFVVKVREGFYGKSEWTAAANAATTAASAWSSVSSNNPTIKGPADNAYNKWTTAVYRATTAANVTANDRGYLKKVKPDTAKDAAYTAADATTAATTAAETKNIDTSAAITASANALDAFLTAYG